MTNEQFESIWINQMNLEKQILLERADSYATHGDRLGNFKEGSVLNDNHPLRYGFGLVSKQIIALRDLITKIDKGEGKFDANELAKFTEFCSDIRNYMVLFLALYQESSEAVKKDK